MSETFSTNRLAEALKKAQTSSPEQQSAPQIPAAEDISLVKAEAEPDPVLALGVKWRQLKERANNKKINIAERPGILRCLNLMTQTNLSDEQVDDINREFDSFNTYITSVENGAVVQKENPLHQGAVAIAQLPNGNHVVGRIFDIGETTVSVRLFSNDDTSEMVLSKNSVEVLSQENLKNFLTTGEQVSIIRGNGSRGVVTIEDFVFIDGQKVRIVWSENGKSASKLCDLADIVKVADKTLAVDTVDSTFKSIVPDRGSEIGDDTLSGFVDLVEKKDLGIQEAVVSDSVLTEKNSERIDKLSALKEMVDNPVKANEVSSKSVYMNEVFPWLTKALSEAGYENVDEMVAESADQINFEADPELSAKNINNLINGFYLRAPKQLSSVSENINRTDVKPEVPDSASEISSVSSAVENSTNPKSAAPFILTAEQRINKVTPPQILAEPTTVEKNFFTDVGDENSQFKAVVDTEDLDAAEEINFEKSEDRVTYYKELQQNVKDIQESATKYLKKFNPDTDNPGVWADRKVYNPHREGLQAAATARMLFYGVFTNNLNKLEEVIINKDIKPEEYHNIAIYIEKLNLSYQRITYEIEKVNQALETVLADAEMVEDTADTEVVVPQVFEAVSNVEDINSISAGLIQRIELTIDAINKSLSPVRKNTDTKSVTELLQLKKNLMNLQGLTQRRLREQDPTVRRNTILGTIKTIDADIKKANTLISIHNATPVQPKVSFEKVTITPGEEREIVESAVLRDPELDAMKKIESQPTNMALVVLAERNLAIQKEMPASVAVRAKGLLGHFNFGKVGRVAALVAALSTLTMSSDKNRDVKNDLEKQSGLTTSFESDLTTLSQSLTPASLQDYVRAVITSTSKEVSAMENTLEVTPVVPTAYTPGGIGYTAQLPQSQSGLVSVESAPVFSVPPKLSQESAKADNTPRYTQRATPDFSILQSSTEKLASYTSREGDNLWDFLQGETAAGLLPAMELVDLDDREALIDLVRDRLNENTAVREKTNVIGATADDFKIDKQVDMNYMNELVLGLAKANRMIQ